MEKYTYIFEYILDGEDEEEDGTCERQSPKEYATENEAREDLKKAIKYSTYTVTEWWIYKGEECTDHGRN